MPLNNKQKQYIDKHHRRRSPSALARTLNLPEEQIKEYVAKKHPRRPLTRRKKIIFSLITISIPVLFFVVLELLLRFGEYRGNLDLFIFPERFDGKYGMLNHYYHEKFFVRTTTFEAGRADVFLKEKPENGFRIFVLGASTAESFPYGYNGLFSLVIRDMLKDVLPDRHVEVVNLGITATNTYSIYDQTRQILQYEPDAIMIYSGQNEYYGALGVASAENLGRYPALVRAMLRLYRYRTFLLLQDAFVGMLNLVTGYDKYEEPGILMERLVQEHMIPLDSRIYEAGKRQFSDNLDAILRQYREHNVPVFLSSLAGNLKDHPPFYSVESEDHPPAREVYRQAQEEYLAGGFESAFRLFRYARDLDGLRFRAPSAFNEIIREKAENSVVWYVPFKERLTEHAVNGIIGNDLMLEHLHPNSEGYFLMGQIFFETLIEAGLPGIEVKKDGLRDPDHYRSSMHLTRLDHRIVWHRVEALMNSWPFVSEPDPRGYPANFTPEHPADRLAYDYVHEHISWEEAKTAMAQWYADNGKHDEAIEEIMGALRVVPYEEEAWRFAARLALQIEQPGQAYEFAMEAYRIRPTAHACRMLGMIAFDREDFEEAAVFLEEAYRYDPDDLNSMFNASIAHASNQNFERAITIVEEIARINPAFPNLQSWHLRLLQDVTIE